MTKRPVGIHGPEGIGFAIAVSFSLSRARPPPPRGQGGVGIDVIAIEERGAGVHESQAESVFAGRQGHSAQGVPFVPLPSRASRRCCFLSGVGSRESGVGNRADG